MNCLVGKAVSEHVVAGTAVAILELALVLLTSRFCFV